MEHHEAQALVNKLARGVIMHFELFQWPDGSVAYTDHRGNGAFVPLPNSVKHSAQQFLFFESDIMKRVRECTPEEIGAILCTSNTENGRSQEPTLYSTSMWDIVGHQPPEPKNLETVGGYVYRLAAYVVVARIWDLVRADTELRRRHP